MSVEREDGASCCQLRGKMVPRVVSCEGRWCLVLSVEREDGALCCQLREKMVPCVVSWRLREGRWCLVLSVGD